MVLIALRALNRVNLLSASTPNAYEIFALLAALIPASGVITSTGTTVALPPPCSRPADACPPITAIETSLANGSASLFLRSTAPAADALRAKS